MPFIRTAARLEQATRLGKIAILAQLAISVAILVFVVLIFVLLVTSTGAPGVPPAPTP